MALTNMKMSKQESKAEVSAPSPNDLPSYPYGLELSLDNDSLKKLGLSDLDVGDKCEITAKAKVTRKSGYESLMGGPDNSIALQITDMEVTPASALYDK